MDIKNRYLHEKLQMKLAADMLEKNGLPADLSRFCIGHDEQETRAHVQRILDRLEPKQHETNRLPWK